MHIHTCTIVYFHVHLYVLILSYTLCFRILYVLFLCWLKSNTFISYLYFSYYVIFYLIFHISRRTTRLILLPSYYILSYVFTYAFMYLSYPVLSACTVFTYCYHELCSCTNFIYYFPRFSDPARGIDPGRGGGQRVRGSTGSNRGSTGQIDPIYIQNKNYIFSYI